MDVNGKTKDNVKARMDLPEYYKRKELWLQETTNNKVFKPKVSYTFTMDQKRKICEWVEQLKMPDGHASNLGKCVDMEHGKLHDTCANTLREDNLAKMEQNIPTITNKLEKILLPGFWDVMEHLPVHLVHEARLGGSIQYRWMYKFERTIGVSKRGIKQRYRLEGSMVEAYLTRETTHFGSYYFPSDVRCLRNRPNCHDDDGETNPFAKSLSIFNQPGKGSKNVQKGILMHWSLSLHGHMSC